MESKKSTIKFNILWLEKRESVQAAQPVEAA
jgi:hypothetical protein